LKRLVWLVALEVVVVSVLGLHYLFASSNASDIEGPSSGYLSDISPTMTPPR